MLYMFTILFAAIDSFACKRTTVLPDVWCKSTTLKTVCKTYGKSGKWRGKTKVNRTVNAAHLNMLLQKGFCQACLRSSSSL